MLAWLILGVAAATLFSSVGPIFYERLFGGGQFTALGETLEWRGAWMTLTGSDAMWAALASDKPGAIAGISAMPSLHVAISVWIYLTARTMAPRAAPYALGYAVFIFLASVQLGWHYVSDGLAGTAGLLLVWALAGLIARPAPASPVPATMEPSRGSNVIDNSVS
jgi:predicted metal-binding membrane protein